MQGRGLEGLGNQKTVAASHPAAPPLVVFRVLVSVATVRICVSSRLRGLLCGVGRLFLEGLLHEQHCLAETFTKITVVR